MYELNLMEDSYTDQNKKKRFNSKRKKMRGQLMTLLPEGKPGIIANHKIKEIGQVAFLSILTSLQTGVRGDFGVPQEKMTVMTKGLPKSVLTSRYEKLRFQHRMNDKIASIPRKIFYNDEALKTDQSIISNHTRDLPKNFPSQLAYPIVWKNIKGKEVFNANFDEIKAIIRDIEKLASWSRNNSKPDGTRWTLIIISFYNRQREKIMDKLKSKYSSTNQRFRSIVLLKNLQIRVFTVDKVQGREADFVFLSLVRNKVKGLGFMDIPNRINVGITRGKFLLKFYGDFNFFKSSGNSYWTRICNQIKENVI